MKTNLMKKPEVKSLPKRKPCKYCGTNNIAIERWSSGGMMYMAKCNNPDCPVPPNGYPTGRKLEEVISEWNKWQADL